MALPSTGVDGTVNMALYDSSRVIVTDDGVVGRNYETWHEFDAILSFIVNPILNVSPTVAYP